MFNFSLTLIVLSLCTLLFNGAVKASIAETRIAFVVSHDKDVYQQIVAATKHAISQDKKVKEKPRFRTFKLSNWELLSKEKKKQYTLVVSVGSKACSELLRNHTRFKFKVLCTFIPKLAFQEQLQKYNIQHLESKKLSVIYLDQPILRQAFLIKQLLPDAKQIGTIVSTLNVEGARRLEESVATSELIFHVLLYNKDKTSKKDLKKLISISDVILAIPDPIVHSPRLAKWMLYNTYRDKKPIIAFSQSYVQAGALAAIFSTPDQIGRQIGEQVLKWINNSQYFYLKTSDPTYYSVAINRTVTKSLGLKIPNDRQIKINIEKEYAKYNKN